jgi:hypothetical protein
MYRCAARLSTTATSRRAADHHTGSTGIGRFLPWFSHTGVRLVKRNCGIVRQ